MTVSLNKVTLEKGQKVDLRKRPQGIGEVLIALNWSQGKKGFLGGLLGGKKAIDLDLAAFVELKDGGRTFVVQALGESFGSLDHAPFVRLSGDDRSGGGGEELKLNGDMWDRIARVQIYTFIYEGVANWSQANGVVTVRAEGNPEIEVRLDQPRDGLGACAIAELRNVDGALQVVKQEEYCRDQEEIDRKYDWGFRWTKGSK